MTVAPAPIGLPPCQQPSQGGGARQLAGPAAALGSQSEGGLLTAAVGDGGLELVRDGGRMRPMIEQRNRWRFAMRLDGHSYSTANIG